MKLEVLGCSGGEGLGLRATSFLINDHLLVDAGSVVSSLSLAQQQSIRHAVITHAHLDHIKDLGFLVDNTFSSREQPLEVYSSSDVIDALKKHYFNWIIWPDFSVLPNPETPVLKFIVENQQIQIEGLTIQFYEVNHPGVSNGFIITEESSDTSILITGDTAVTQKIWQAAKTTENLKAIFVDTAFPDSKKELAELSGHYTPKSLCKDLKEFSLLALPIYCYHLKPAFHDEVEADISALCEDNVVCLQQGQTLFF